MKVHLREREQKKGKRISLYLEYYKGSRKSDEGKSLPMKKILFYLFCLIFITKISNAQSLTNLDLEFGSTEQELIKSIQTEQYLINQNFNVYDRGVNSVTLVCTQGEDSPPRFKMMIRVTCYFSNDILYKIKEEVKFNKWYGREEPPASTINRVYTKLLEQQWFEKSKEIKFSEGKGFHSTTWRKPQRYAQIKFILADNWRDTKDAGKIIYSIQVGKQNTF